MLTRPVSVTLPSFVASSCSDSVTTAHCRSVVGRLGQAQVRRLRGRHRLGVARPRRAVPLALAVLSPARVQIRLRRSGSVAVQVRSPPAPEARAGQGRRCALSSVIVTGPVSVTLPSLVDHDSCSDDVADRSVGRLASPSWSGAGAASACRSPSVAVASFESSCRWRWRWPCWSPSRRPDPPASIGVAGRAGRRRPRARGCRPGQVTVALSSVTVTGPASVTLPLLVTR